MLWILCREILCNVVFEFGDELDYAPAVGQQILTQVSLFYF